MVVVALLSVDLVKSVDVVFIDLVVNCILFVDRGADHTLIFFMPYAFYCLHGQKLDG